MRLAILTVQTRVRRDIDNQAALEAALQIEEEESSDYSSYTDDETDGFEAVPTEAHVTPGGPPSIRPPQPMQSHSTPPPPGPTGRPSDASPEEKRTVGASASNMSMASSASQEALLTPPSAQLEEALVITPGGDGEREGPVVGVSMLHSHRRLSGITEESVAEEKRDEEGR